MDKIETNDLLQLICEKQHTRNFHLFKSKPPQYLAKVQRMGMIRRNCVLRLTTSDTMTAQYSPPQFPDKTLPKILL